MQINFTKYSPVYYIFSGLLIVASIVSLAVFGLKFGIEFTGGSSLEVIFSDSRPSNDEVMKAISELNLGEVIIQPVDQKGMLLRFKEIDEPTHQQIVSKLKELKPLEEKRFELVGPSIGKELEQKTVVAISLTLVAITLYIAFAFRKVSKPVASWKYGIASLIALFHDIIIPLGIFSVLGKFFNAEITTPIVTALLTILGFSVHDTIVIFDRIRENLLTPYRFSDNKLGKPANLKPAELFESTVNRSLNQTLGRSINTVLTVLIVLFAIFFFGGLTLKYFALALIVGIISGAYSSIFIASALLVTWFRFQEKRRGY